MKQSKKKEKLLEILFKIVDLFAEGLVVVISLLWLLWCFDLFYN